MPWATPPTYTAGEALPASKLTAVSALLDAGVMRPIGHVELAIVSSQIEFTTIPGTFRSLAIAYYGHCDAAVVNANLQIRFNTDSTALYSYGGLQNSSTTLTGHDGLAQTSAVVGVVPGASGSGSAMGSYWIVIPGYTIGTRYKSFTAVGGYRDTDTAGGVHARQEYGTYQSVAAISNIRLFLSSGNHGIGTVCTLYGLPYV